MQETSKVVGAVARLKPEIRLTQAISEFSLCLDDDSQRIRFKNLQSRAFPNSSDLITFVEELNRDGSRLHKSWKPYATRLVGLLDRIRQFAPAGDILIGGSQNLLACGVWAALRLSLEVSISILSYFDKVSAFLLRAGNLSSIHQEMTDLYPRCQRLQTYMCEYSICIVGMSRKIVTYFKKSSLSQISMAMSFDAKFKPLENDLQLWGNLIEKRAAVLSQQSNLESHKSMLERLNIIQRSREKDSQRESVKELRRCLLSVLSPDQNEFETTWRRERKKGTSDWIFKSEPYINWLNCGASSTLWLKGNLGSGKTVTMANVLGNLYMLEKQKSYTIVYFFCKSDSLRTLKADTIIGSITFQILEDPNLEENVFRYLADNKPTPFTKCPSAAECVNIVLNVTPTTWKCILVLDGLEECKLSEVSEIFEYLAQLMKAREVLLMCSSRPSADLLALSSHSIPITYTISMDHLDRRDDIERAISAELHRWKIIRELEPGLEQLIKEQLKMRSQGMFLWLALQFEAICPRHTNFLCSDAEILDIIGNLPKTINESFDRALLRIKDKRFGPRLYQLVTSADPALTLDELCVAANVEPGNSVWNASTAIYDGKALLSYYGGSLLDVDEEDSKVRFIHHSALSYLVDISAISAISPFHFDFPTAEIIMASTCVTFLNYSLFDTRVSTGKKVSMASVPEKTVANTLNSHGLARKIMSIMINDKSSSVTEIDLERLSTKLKKQQGETNDRIFAFLEYATSHWLRYTKRITTSSGKSVYLLWKNLIKGNVPIIHLQWDLNRPDSALTWSITNSHLALFRYLWDSSKELDQTRFFGILDYFANVTPDDFGFEGDDIRDLTIRYFLWDSMDWHTLQFLLERVGSPVRPQLHREDADDQKPAGAELSPSLSTLAATRLFQALSDRTSLLPDIVLDFLAEHTKLPAVNDFMKGDKSILHMAIETGRETIPMRLLSNGADCHSKISIDGETLLQAAFRQGMTLLARRLITCGAYLGPNEPSELHPPVLFQAIDKSDDVCVKSLILRGAHNPKYRYGRSKQSTLHFACQKYLYDHLSDHHSLYCGLEALLENNADVNAQNADGETPLMLLVQSYVLNVKTSWRAQALNWAVNLLVSRHDMNPNIGNSSGVTPLMVAAYQHASNIVSALLKAGADPNLRISGRVKRQHLYALQGPRRGSTYPSVHISSPLTVLYTFSYLPKEDVTALSIAFSQVVGLQAWEPSPMEPAELLPQTTPLGAWNREENIVFEHYYHEIISILLDYNANLDCHVDNRTAATIVKEGGKEWSYIAKRCDMKK